MTELYNALVASEYAKLSTAALLEARHATRTLKRYMEPHDDTDTNPWAVKLATLDAALTQRSDLVTYGEAKLHVTDVDYVDEDTPIVFCVRQVPWSMISVLRSCTSNADVLRKFFTDTVYDGHLLIAGSHWNHVTVRPLSSVGEMGLAVEVRVTKAGTWAASRPVAHSLREWQPVTVYSDDDRDHVLDVFLVPSREGALARFERRMRELRCAAMSDPSTYEDQDVMSGLVAAGYLLYESHSSVVLHD